MAGGRWKDEPFSGHFSKGKRGNEVPQRPSSPQGLLGPPSFLVYSPLCKFTCKTQRSALNSPWYLHKGEDEREELTRNYSACVIPFVAAPLSRRGERWCREDGILSCCRWIKVWNSQTEEFVIFLDWMKLEPLPIMNVKWNQLSLLSLYRPYLLLIGRIDSCLCRKGNWFLRGQDEKGIFESLTNTTTFCLEPSSSNQT